MKDFVRLLKTPQINGGKKGRPIMAKFTKAKAEQAKFKAGLYGSQGSGKTFTALLMAEGLAKREKKRIAYIDTERGTDFYAMSIPERKVHPAAFDFDRIVTRSIMETLEAVEGLDANEYGVLVIDSITHLWEAAKEAYRGKRMSNGAIPVQAWGDIKRPYKQLMTEFLNGNFHAIVCGREGVVMETNEDGETEVVGRKMKAEGETPYEPHVLGRMILDHGEKATIKAFFEKDRSGILTGRIVEFPDFATIEPIVKYLSGEVQGGIGNIDATAEADAAKIQEREEAQERERTAMYDSIRLAIASAGNIDQLKAAWELTKGKKGKLGDFFDKLEIAKETRKSELVQSAVA